MKKLLAHGLTCGISCTGWSTSSGSSAGPHRHRPELYHPQRWLTISSPNEWWFIFSYGSRFFLLAMVTALLCGFDASYDKLCLMMFSA